MTDRKNIFAFTETEGYKDYPAYVSINRDENGQHDITVRTRDKWNIVAHIAVTPERWASQRGRVSRELRPGAGVRGLTHNA